MAVTKHLLLTTGNILLTSFYTNSDANNIWYNKIKYNWHMLLEL
jgi:hypothetical protein